MPPSLNRVDSWDKEICVVRYNLKHSNTRNSIIT